MIGWEYETGVVTLESSRLKDSDVSEEIETSSGVPLLRTYSILRKTLFHRVIEFPLFLPSDGYGLACASLLEPEALQSAIYPYTGEELEPFFNALEAYCSVPRSGHSSQIDGCRFPAVAKDPWGKVAEAVNGPSIS